ncbi:unnamed protein product [Prorocentrum cordatum]|uniref:Uncharacterized protein n=1 Tax=Prorocentrum cordatum TaxID=2364126 RepID=A0ABN9TZG6_9DINO|nr:unnamed protein product [Polarella glacialis]
MPGTSANLLRPISQDSEVGLDVSTCQQIDLGGLCPAWAQRFLTRFAVSRAIQWGEQIRSQCRLLEEARQGVPRAGPAAVPPPVEESARAAESVDRLERSRSRDQEPMSGEEGP